MNDLKHNNKYNNNLVIPVTDMVSNPNKRDEMMQRSKSTASYAYPTWEVTNKDHRDQMKRSKSTNGAITGLLCFGDPEMQRKKRVVGYKVYGFEGKVKGSFRKSFRWIKERYFNMVLG
ncbi:hypothetical protein Droror1_Dr00005951 [Drosera rotundifolia]